VTLAVPSDAVRDVELGRFTLSYVVGSERATLAFTDVPHVTCVQAEEDFFAGVDASSWTRSVLVDGYNAMQQRVAQEVKAGRPAAARALIQRFRDDTTAMNTHVQSAPVAAQLKSVDKLDADVGAAFTGDNQPEKQNELSKTRSAAALDDRRAGGKQ
jgi:hypothetical protein